MTFGKIIESYCKRKINHVIKTIEEKKAKRDPLNLEKRSTSNILETINPMMAHLFYKTSFIYLFLFAKNIKIFKKQNKKLF